MVVRDLLEFEIILLGFDFLTRFSWRGKKKSLLVWKEMLFFIEIVRYFCPSLDINGALKNRHFCKWFGSLSPRWGLIVFCARKSVVVFLG